MYRSLRTALSASTKTRTQTAKKPFKDSKRISKTPPHVEAKGEYDKTKRAGYTRKDSKTAQIPPLTSDETETRQNFLQKRPKRRMFTSNKPSDETDAAVRYAQIAHYASVRLLKGQIEFLETRQMPNDLPGDSGSKKSLKKRLEGLLSAETESLERFNDLIRSEDLRPSLLTPIWGASSYALGVLSTSLDGLIGESAALGVNEVVRRQMGDEFNKSIRKIIKDRAQAKQKSEERDPEESYGVELEKEIMENIAKSRDEQIEFVESVETENDVMTRSILFELLEAGIKTGRFMVRKISEKV